MKLLEEILDAENLINDAIVSDKQVHGVAVDSRQVSQGYMFIAYKGNAVDGHDYIDQAIQKGARYILLDNAEFVKDSEVDYLLVEDARKLVSGIASTFYDHPSRGLKVVGVTGTNGKTTTVNLLYDLFEKMGYKTGLVSTIENKYGDTVIPAKLTTPDAVSLQALFREMLDNDVTHVFMEVSSHALHQGRVSAVEYDVAIFTNITHDHLDYHGTFAEYIKAKKILFDNLASDSVALINADDSNARVMVQNTKARIKTYSLKRPSDFKCKIISNDLNGLQLEFNQREVYLMLVGRFNAYNAMAAYATGLELGIEETELLVSLSMLRPAEGRFDIVRSDKASYTSIVDYAHTPDALQKVLETILELKNEDSKLICVVGCGGNRDKSKRPLMAKIASRLSDKCIFTSDNPRNENASDIIDDMLAGLSEDEQAQCLKIEDRKEAIKLATMLAEENDVILVAGKGHEKYQEIKGQRFPFDDKEIIHAFMR